MTHLPLLRAVLSFLLVTVCLGGPAVIAQGSTAEIVCLGVEEVELRGRVIETAGHGIVAGGTCDVTIRDSRIVVGGYAIVALGTADVTIRNSTIEGAEGGLVAIENGEIEFRGTVVRGGVRAAQTGEIHDRGGNEVTGRVARLPSAATLLRAEAAAGQSAAEIRLPGVRVDERGVTVGGPEGVVVGADGVSVGGESAVEVLPDGVRIGGPRPESLRPGDPVRCDRSGRMTIENRLIETDGDGVAVLANCTVTIRSSRILAGGYGILNAASGRVVLEDSYVSGSKGGVLLSGNGTVSYRGSTIRGGVRSLGNGRLVDEGGNDLSGIADASALGEAIDRSAGRGSSPELDRGEIRIDESGVRLGDIVVGADSIRIGSDVIAIEAVGDFVRLDVGDVRVDAGWRDRTSAYSSADVPRLLDELGARRDGGETAIDLSGDVLFDFGSAEITPAAAEQLAKLAQVLRRDAREEISILGHTDSVGSEDENQRLSEARVVAVMRWLNQREGIPAGLMRGRGYGETRPIAHNTKPDGSDDPAGRARNRRVEIRYR